MAYQIPQQLEYKEKIMFGLTFKQLVYAFLFGAIALIIFRRIDNFYLRCILGMIPCLIGTGFIFLNLEQRIKDIFHFLKFREIKKENMQKFFGIKEVKDNLIIKEKNQKVSILKVSTINFSIKSDKEKESIIHSFQKFLNSLDFPTQILVKTESINLDEYLLSLNTKNFTNLIEQYKNYLLNTISNKKIMNRSFYVIIPETSEIEIQTQICLERLISLNLKVKRLNDLELIKLLKESFKGEDNEMFPKIINNKMDYLEISGEFQKIIYSSGYPRYVESGFLDRIISSLGDFDLSIYIKPYPIEGMLVGLNRELQKQKADLYAMHSKGISNPSLEIQYKDTQGTLEDLQKGKERLFNVSLYVNCKANSMKELNLLSKKVESELNSLMILPKTPYFRMLSGFKSVSPLAKDDLNFNRNITTEALSAFFPFSSQFLETDNNGIWLGLNKNNIPIIKEIFNFSNPNGLVLAQSGGGKSYFCKLLISRYLMNGTKVMVIDPQGEYNSLISRFKGQRIDLSKNSDTIINPLDLMGHDYIEKRLSLMDLMKIMLGDLSDIQRAFIDKALTRTYEIKGITKNPDTWQNEPPILEDLFNTLKSMEKKASSLEKTTINSLSSRLDMYVHGVFSFFNKHTNIDFDNNFVSFDIGNMPSQVKPATMFLVLDYIYMKMKATLEKKILLIDESWSLLSRSEEAGYIFEIVKTCRKFNLGLLLINQEVEGLLDSKAGKSVLANSSYAVLMKQKPAVIDNICKTFHLSKSERTYLLTAGIGEGLLIIDDEHSELKVISSPEEHKLITTNPQEIVLTKIVKNYKKGVKISVDENQRFFRKKELDKPNLDFLLRRGYKIEKRKSIVTNKIEEFVLQPRTNETSTHLFVVYDIKEYLEKKGIKVQIYQTAKPDIVFELNGKKIAIEVETGNVLKVKSRMEAKLKVLGEYNKWFFIVTDRNLTKKYREFGNTVDIRYIKEKLKKLVCKKYSQSA